MLENFSDDDYKQKIIVSLGSKYPQATAKDLADDIKALGLDEKYKPVSEGGKNKTFHLYRGTSKDNSLPKGWKNKGLPLILQAFRNDVSRVWNFLFKAVFGIKGKTKKTQGQESEVIDSWVEINVRHYLRECVAYHLGGNEYLSPDQIGKKGFTESYSQLREEFCCWLEIVDEVARQYNKKLLLKLPFRGDLLFFIHLILDVRAEKIKKYSNDKKKDYGIQGITLINAFKALEDEQERNDVTDKKWKYQMSGELLAGPRNEILAALFKEIRQNEDVKTKLKGMCLHIGGGVVTSNEIEYLKQLQISEKSEDKSEDTYVQIGTWGLLDLPSNFCNNKLQKSVNPTHLPVNINSPKNMDYRFAYLLSCKCKCIACNTINTYYCDVFIKRGGFSNVLTNCCDANQPRGIPLMDPRNCTGCGLCVQCCASGAIQLFKPEHFVCLIGEDAKVAWEAHKMLTDAQIPHFVYTREQLSEIINPKPPEATVENQGNDQLFNWWKDACKMEGENCSVKDCPVMAIYKEDGNTIYCFAENKNKGNLQDLVDMCKRYHSPDSEKEKILGDIPECFRNIVKEVDKRLKSKPRATSTETKFTSSD